jgi:hypothetical protein
MLVAISKPSFLQFLLTHVYVMTEDLHGHASET